MFVIMGSGCFSAVPSKDILTSWEKGVERGGRTEWIVLREKYPVGLSVRGWIYQKKDLDFGGRSCSRRHLVICDKY